MKQSVVSLAMERVPIETVLSKLGVSADGGGKIFCPFGDLYHADQGYSRAMRVYSDTNTCYCFACTKGFNPVSLWSYANDLPYEQAALQMLDWVGYVPKTVDERIAATQEEKLDIQPELLAQSLKRYCMRLDPQWTVHQTDAGVARKLAQCLDLLDSISTKEDVEKWRTATKEVMKKVIENV